MISSTSSSAWKWKSEECLFHRVLPLPPSTATNRRAECVMRGSPGTSFLLLCSMLLCRAATPFLRYGPTAARHRPFSPSTTAAAAKTVLVPIAHGSEEIETTCICDTLVRAGAEVTVASVEPGELLCKMSRGIRIMADASLVDDGALEAQSWDAVVIPGGMPGAERLRDCEPLTRILKKQAEAPPRIVAAVCAAPAVVLETHGILAGRTATCYPAPPFTEKLEQGGVEASNDAVVVSGNVVTSRGPGTSLLFALKLVELLFGPDKKDELAAQMLVTV